MNSWSSIEWTTPAMCSFTRLTTKPPPRDKPSVNSYLNIVGKLNIGPVDQTKPLLATIIEKLVSGAMGKSLVTPTAPANSIIQLEKNIDKLSLEKEKPKAISKDTNVFDAVKKQEFADIKADLLNQKTPKLEIKTEVKHETPKLELPKPAEIKKLEPEKKVEAKVDVPSKPNTTQMTMAKKEAEDLDIKAPNKPDKIEKIPTQLKKPIKEDQPKGRPEGGKKTPHHDEGIVA
jgi:hypothetical protein